ncbi:hypothetical protein FRC10_007021 [Ceratobasidium sp. 414]|nr:hypothetical protein FRC10_007021 [Ceratobasidium sp. 414]
MGLQEFACRCLNITVRSAPLESAPAPVSDSTLAHYERVYVGDAGIHVVRIIQPGSDSVLTVLAVPQSAHPAAAGNTRGQSSEIPPNFELKDGLVAPGEEFAEAEILRGRDGYIEVNVGSDGCLDAKRTSAARENDSQYSRAFDLLLPSTPKPAALPATPQRPSSPTPASTPRPHLPTLPPLFHPPPYSPSHPVFGYLSKKASVSSNQLRTQAEQAIQAFVDSQVAEVLDKERHIRGEVEVIWSRWRDNWRQQVGPDSILSPETAHASAAVSVGEFSPTAIPGSGSPTAPAQGSHVPLPVRRPSMPPTHSGPSMLSQSLRQSNFVAPPPPSTPSPQHNGQRDATTRNTVDDSFAVSASFQIRAGDEMRARESAREAEQRRLKRLSQQGKSGAPPTVPEEEQSGDEETRVRPRNGVAEGKRKVTFQADVKEEDGASQPVPRKDDGDGDYSDVEATGTRESGRPFAEFKLIVFWTTFSAVLFNLDEDEGDQPSAIVEDGASTPEQPVTPRAKAKARAKSKTAKQPPPIGRKAPVPALLTVDLSSTPAPSKPKAPPKSVQQTTKVRQVRPGEDKLLELLAANLPSHRDAWKPGGKAWGFFDARRKFADSPDTASLTSEEPNGAMGDNPSKFATSLPVRIAAGPLTMDTAEEREPKTSLHNEPGVLVPPLRLHTQTPRQSRERTYAMRDLARSVDPGPVLELQAAEDAAGDTDEDETEGEDTLGEMSSAERVRRRTMRIVQRQSGVPDAGMWRSVAS